MRIAESAVITPCSDTVGPMAAETLALTALEQAAAIRSGELSATEVVEATLEAIERLDPELNAFVTLCGERALEESRAVSPGDSRPLAGVPVAIKDLTALTEGVRTTMGMEAMGDWVPSRDSSTVRRLRRAGAIVVGKTSTPELGILPITEPARFGPTRNPWNRARTPGGSSGGSAAAVAAGMVALAHGSDGGGSLRIPASCCGLVGLKPSRGRISLAPAAGDVLGLGTEGMLSRTVADTAVALDLLAGYEPGDPHWAPPPSAPFAAAARSEPAPLRVAYTTEAPNGAPVAAACVEAVEAAARLLESLGHQVEEAAPEPDERFIEAFLAVWTTGVEQGATAYLSLRGAELDLERVEPLTREMIEGARSLSTLQLLQAIEHLRRSTRRVVLFWSGYDVLLTPTLAQPPLRIGEMWAPAGEPAVGTLLRSAQFVPFTPQWNVTGQPAISLPLHLSAEGLPIGVQLVGPPAGEDVLLALAAQLEQAAPWAQRRPAGAPA